MYTDDKDQPQAERDSLQALKSLEGLLSENDKMRLLMIVLESDRVKLEEQLMSARDALKENEDLQGLVVSLEDEKKRLQDQAQRVKEELQRHKKEQMSLQEQMTLIEEENRRFLEQHSEGTRQNFKLANLYVSSYRLHETLDRNEVLEIIKEIVIGLVGSEELGIFEMDETGSALRLLASMGIEEERFKSVALGEGLIGGAALSGDIYMVGESEGAPLAGEEDLTACIPLKLDEKVVGVIAVFKLLSQKAGFENLDQDLFELLTLHAGTALYCSGLHAKASMAIVG